MSKNRENVVWQSPDGTWNRAFYAYEEQSWKDDFDEEWDVEYDYSRFSWLSHGHPTREAAEESWRGANPGGYSVFTNREDVQNLEQLAAGFRAKKPFN